MKPLSTAAVVLLLSTGLQAKSYGPSREIHLGETDKDIDKKLDRLSKKLDLTPEQLHKAKIALEEERLRMDSLKKEIAEARRKIIEDADGAMKTLLNPQQQEKYSGFREEIIGKPEPVDDGMPPHRPGY